MPMHNPAHPGRLIKHRLIIDEDGNRIDSVAAVAKKLGVNRNTVNTLINCKSAVTPKMAVALEKTGTGSAEMWMGMQTAYDLFEARKSMAA